MFCVLVIYGHGRVLGLMLYVSPRISLTLTLTQLPCEASPTRDRGTSAFLVREEARGDTQEKLRSRVCVRSKKPIRENGEHKPAEFVQGLKKKM